MMMNVFRITTSNVQSEVGSGKESENNVEIKLQIEKE